MPLALLIYGGGALLFGGATYGVYKGASDGTKAVMQLSALIGGGYLVYKRMT